jgi:hypothetical protein
MEFVHNPFEGSKDSSNFLLFKRNYTKPGPIEQRSKLGEGNRSVDVPSKRRPMVVRLNHML